MSIPKRGAVKHGDCRKIPLPDDSVDLVVTSPPYEDARTYTKAVSVLKGDDWVDYHSFLFEEQLRVCKGVVCWIVNSRTRRFHWSPSPFQLCLALAQCGYHLRKPLIYRRHGIPGSGGPDWFADKYEFIICASKYRRRLEWSENTAMGGPPKCKPGGATSHRRKDGQRVEGRRVVVERVNPGNIIDCGAVGGGNIGSKTAHKGVAPFPEQIPEFLIRSLCRPGGLVCDPMCGTGTTLVTAKAWGRRWFGMDIQKNQVNLSRERLKEIKWQAKLQSDEQKRKQPKKAKRPARRQSTKTSRPKTT